MAKSEVGSDITQNNSQMVAGGPIKLYFGPFQPKN